jgi:hypothetical protein
MMRICKWCSLPIHKDIIETTSWIHAKSGKRSCAIQRKKSNFLRCAIPDEKLRGKL